MQNNRTPDWIFTILVEENIYDYLGQKVKVKYYDIYVDKATGQLAIFQKSTGNLVVITDYFI